MSQEPRRDAGYSGTPMAKKLGLRPGHVVALLDAPTGWEIADLPEGVHPRTDLRGRAHVVVAFFRELAALRRSVGRLDRAVRGDTALWVLWPRRAGGHDSDITENDLRDLFLPTGLVDVKVAAVDQDWSGLKLVRRRALR